ncbi:hypothetical protein OG339_43735 [Streptosporangium sp. NBC_01495]|uniref:hypothetical protein n=1 Tax=Streptosporangium sp. NBC_01495 TaxID=2903899 RepID=UPI002E364A88|nr:hypothetical protein [Streptosporangium sp. NBC_01495]
MTTRRSRGDGGLHWDETRERWIASVTVGYTPAGKRIVKKADGKTKTETKAAAHAEAPSPLCEERGFVRGDWDAFSASKHGRTLALPLRRPSRWVLERTVGAHHRLAVDDARVPLEVARLGLGGARGRKTDDHQRRGGGGGEGDRTPDKSSH